ncbi:MAG: MraY family glycosyltransferase [Candidatus Peribacteraceae bacterium]|nr:MraY family glycosyltransferase [Candidatus Peribacteraceae bacterium]MDD5075014.1 MraY family glycosyltransferase [Candidatus Peribacteraceae bacterium]
MPLFNSPLLWLPLLSCALTVLLHLWALKVFPRWGILDFPERYGLTRKPIPYPTGIFAVISFLVFFITFEALLAKKPWSLQACGLIAGIVLLALVTFRDDRRPLPSSLRLLVQIIVALVIFLTGTRIYTLTNPLAGITGLEVLPLHLLQLPVASLGYPSLLGMLFTVVWLGLTMNALNWFDGIRGQVSLLSVFGFLTIGLLSLSERVGDVSLGLMALALAGISFGCLLFDRPGPLALIGDTGSMFFGLMLGVLTIFTGGKVATGFLVLGVPLIDSVIVIIRRLLKGKSIFKGDTQNEHLHHRLLRRGWSEWQIITLTAALGASFGITALFLNTFQKFLAALALTLIMFLLSIYSGRKDEVESAISGK